MPKIDDREKIAKVASERVILDNILPVKHVLQPTAVYMGFDPGKTTGIAVALFDENKMELEVAFIKPFELNEVLGKFVKLDSPPIICYQALYAFVDELLNAFGFDDTNLKSLPVHVAIEDFTGGTGGNLQNTVNKLIGIISGAVFSWDDVLGPPKIFRNSSRRPYLERVGKLTESDDKYKGMSHHSKDALAHLFNRVFQDFPDQFKNGTLKVY